MNKLGKIGKYNMKVNRTLKKMYDDLEINYCEVGLSDCMGITGLTFAHRHKRIQYRGQMWKLGLLNQSLVACINCHQKMEKSKSLTERIFNRLRGKEIA